MTTEHFTFEPDDDQEDRPAFATRDSDEAAGSRRRMWIIGVLVLVAGLVYVAQRYVTSIEPDLKRLQDREAVAAVRLIEERTRKVFDAYGILDEWVTRKSVSLPQVDSVRTEWRVNIPRDVPIASLNLDLKHLAESEGGAAYAVEDVKTAQVCVHMRFGSRIRYSVIFTPDPALVRREGRIALLLDGMEEASNSNIDAFLQSREPIGCILIPSRANVPLYERVRSGRKDIVMQLHFFAAKQQGNSLALSEDLSDDDIRRRIKGIVKTFPSAGLYFFSAEKALRSNSRAADAELSANGYRKIEATALSYVDRTSELTTVTSRMNDLAAVAARYGSAIGVLRLKDGTMEFLRDAITRLRKKGFDFVSVRSLL